MFLSSFSFTQAATDLMASFGYGGLAITLFLDSFGIPIPSEVVLPLAGALLRDGRMSLAGILIAAVLAQTLGGFAGYLIGRYGGVPVIERYGRYFLISRGDLEYTRRTFAKYGSFLVLIGRCLPVIRGLVGYPAGIAEMNEAVFLLFTAVGSLIWSIFLVWCGYALGGNAEQVDQIINRFSVIIIVAILAAVAWHVVHYIRDEQKFERQPKHK